MILKKKHVRNWLIRWLQNTQLFYFFKKQSHYKTLEIAQPLRTSYLWKGLRGLLLTGRVPFVKPDINTMQITMTLMEKLPLWLKRILARGTLGRLNLLRPNCTLLICFQKKSEYRKALCRPGPESTLSKTFLRFSLVKSVQTRLDKKSHGLKKKPAGDLKPKDIREMKGSTTN